MVTTSPEMEQLAEAVGSIVTVTGSPEVAVAVTVQERPTHTTWMEIVWDPLPTGNVCWTWGAGFQFALPGWLASITQFPAAVKLTTSPEMEQSEEVVESIVMATVSPELALAVGV